MTVESLGHAPADVDSCRRGTLDIGRVGGNICARRSSRLFVLQVAHVSPGSETLESRGSHCAGDVVAECDHAASGCWGRSGNPRSSSRRARCMWVHDHLGVQRLAFKSRACHHRGVDLHGRVERFRVLDQDVLEGARGPRCKARCIGPEPVWPTDPGRPPERKFADPKPLFGTWRFHVVHHRVHSERAGREREHRR